VTDLTMPERRIKGTVNLRHFDLAPLVKSNATQPATPPVFSSPVPTPAFFTPLSASNRSCRPNIK
jgi:hypothetical protein